MGMGVTDWVRRALADLGPDASVKQIGDYIVARDPSVPRSYVSLAVRNVKKKRGHSADQGEDADSTLPFKGGPASE
jgi:hypothetical protein